MPASPPSGMQPTQACKELVPVPGPARPAQGHDVTAPAVEFAGAQGARRVNGAAGWRPPPVCRCAFPVARGQPSAPLGACARKPMPALPTPAETWKQPRIHREGQEDHTRRRRRLGRTQSGKSEPPGPHACVRWESQDTQKRATRGLRIGFRGEWKDATCAAQGRGAAALPRKRGSEETQRQSSAHGRPRLFFENVSRSIGGKQTPHPLLHLLILGMGMRGERPFWLLGLGP